MPPVEFALLDVWKVANRIAVKRLVPCLEAFVEALERLARLGFEAASASGASLSPFVGADLVLSPAPESDRLAAWEDYATQVAELLAADADLAGELVGHLL